MHADAVTLRSSRLFAPLRLVSLLTLLSRVLGLARDVGMAVVFGGGPVMDAFSVAFRLPNLARRLFGEGALTAAFLPVFVRELEAHSGRQSAWKLASAVLGLLAITLTALVLIAEALLIGLMEWGGFSAETDLLLGLTAVLLPYLIVICVAAQISAVQHALGQFAWPALLPALLNVIWIAALAVAVWLFETDRQRIYAVAVCVMLAGVVQVLAPLPALWRLGFRFDAGWWSARRQVQEIARAMLPVVLGLSVTQLNTFADSLIAWGFAAPLGASDATMPLPGGPAYPLDSGTASALYFGQRMYQFPLGVFGVALGTVLFPLLARHAERGRLDA
ncbi:MAG: lipid II flippase MurJ, partial [Planctomycetaceae bacterium]